MRNYLQRFESRVAPRYALAPLTPPAPLSALSYPRKIINKKIWDVSLTFRHITLLESINRLRKYRGNARNKVEFTLHNSFRIRKNIPKIDPQIFRPQASLPKGVTRGSWRWSLPSRVCCLPFAVCCPLPTVHRHKRDLGYLAVSDIFGTLRSCAAIAT